MHMDEQTTERVLSYLTNAITDELSVFNNLVIARCYILREINPDIVDLYYDDRSGLHDDDKIVFDQIKNFIEVYPRPFGAVTTISPLLRDVLINLLPNCTTEGGLYSMIYREINIYEQIIQRHIRFVHWNNDVYTLSIRDLIAYNVDRLHVHGRRPPIILHVFFQLMNIIMDINFDHIRRDIVESRRTGRELNRTIEFE
jgi:hypothetical protein